MAKLLFITTLTFLSLFSAVQSSAIKPRGNDFILGETSVGDSILFGQVYMIPGKLNELTTQQVIYNGTKVITRIRAIDLNTDGTGGYVTLLSGGIGQRNVTLILQSSGLGRNIETFVDIYGR